MTQPPTECGCGIACVSMVTGESYEAMKNKLSDSKGWSSRKRKFRTTYKELSFLLANVNHDFIKYETMEDIYSPSIIGVNNEGNKYHWVLAFRKNKELYIADSESGELYKYNNWKDDYDLHKRNNCIVFPRVEISNIEIQP